MGGARRVELRRRVEGSWKSDAVEVRRIVVGDEADVIAIGKKEEEKLEMSRGEEKNSR